MEQFAELCAAVVQLARDNTKLCLPAYYWTNFQDVEPFLLELALPGQGLKSIKAAGRKLVPTLKKGGKPWNEGELWANAYVVSTLSSVAPLQQYCFAHLTSNH